MASRPSQHPAGFTDTQPSCSDHSPLYSGDEPRLPASLVDALDHLDRDGCFLAVLPEFVSYQSMRPLNQNDLVLLDAHPADWLLGLDLAERTSTLAIVAPGQIVGPKPQPVTTLAVVNTAGKGSLHVFVNGQQSLVATNAQGLVPDAMRRALGVPTPQAQFDPGWYWALRWLQELQRDGLSVSPEVLGLEDVISAHPAIEPDEWDGVAWSGLGEFCRDRHSDHSWRTGWGGIRSSIVRASAAPGETGPSEVVRAARWHDDGSFSRWFVSKHLPLSEVFDTVSVMLDPIATELVGGVVRDVLARARP